MTTALRTAEDLDALARVGESTLYPAPLKLLIGSASCGISAGAREVEAAALEALKAAGLDAVVARTGCIGFCQAEPLVDVILPEGPRVCFSKVTPAGIRSLIEGYAKTGHLKADAALCRFVEEKNVSAGTARAYPPGTNGLGQVPEWSTVDFYRPQERVILRNCGSIDPMSLAEAVARGAYRGAIRALTRMTPEQVVAEVTASGLRGRGGAGFPTGRKWDAAGTQVADAKYFICNADEGDPGAFMDRSVMEGDPHAVLEGMLIGAYAIGAARAFVYVRSEYPLAVSTMEHAIAQAKAVGLLGKDIFGSGFDLEIEIRRGAGAFVCGEETALIASIEGRAGEPRPRPPYPAVKGLWGKPTVINNVKTLSSVGAILARGAAWYAARGVEGNRGTTVFSLVGAVKNTGLVEVPLGISLRQMIYDIGGGPSGSKPVKAVQTGGPSGGCIPAAMLDLTIDYEKLAQAGAMMGSGGMIVIDESTCMVDLARFFLTFTAEESCGKCAPCREGTKQMLRILTRICEGEGKAEDLQTLQRLATTIKAASLCGLGQTAPNPVLTAMRYFGPEFEAHVRDRKCPAGVCRNLTTFKVDESACIGCGRCVKVCAVSAVAGTAKKAHRIDEALCTRCGACRSVCPADAVINV
ncbi:MAG: NADH-quinone oxidoreductase subunit NuoF [Planctomycetota bacterium]|nr:NADH-quinone oxidoreductase subunit NuoF [Planctomycetota bacterium]